MFGKKVPNVLKSSQSIFYLKSCLFKKAKKVTNNNLGNFCKKKCQKAIKNSPIWSQWMKKVFVRFLENIVISENIFYIFKMSMKKDRLVIVNKLKDFSGCLKPVQTGFNRFGTFKTGRKSFLTCFKLLSNFGKVIICFRPILHFLKTIFDVSHGGREGGSLGQV